jgi:4,5-dihydroxyphthalate decarboxylase
MIRLSLAISSNPRTAALVSGQVKVQDVEFDVRKDVSDLFARQVRQADFDVSELSFSALLIMLASDRRDWLPIPVFPERRFFHVGIWVRRDAGISRPEDLRGRRVGVQEYVQTAHVWTRSTLLHEFGLEPRDLEWYFERTGFGSIGEALDVQVPAGVRWQPIPSGVTIRAMLDNGDLDAAFAVGFNPARPPADPLRVRPLFDDPVAEGRRYYGATGIVPINHVIVIRGALADRYPELPKQLYAGFCAAKDAWLQRVSRWLQAQRSIGEVPGGIESAFELDAYPYGVAPNRRALDALGTFVVEQELVSRFLGPEEIFGAGV